MLKFKAKRIAAHTDRALDRLHAIEAAIIALDNDDLLDFADIFAGGEASPLRDIATAEMERRSISL